MLKTHRVETKGFSLDILKSSSLLEYNYAIAEMKRLVEEIKRDQSKTGALWFLEHEHTYTGGATYSEDDIRGEDVRVIKTDRGGKITYHGPGQRVVYVMLNLNFLYDKIDIRDFIKRLESWLQATSSELGIKPLTEHEQHGLWVEANGKKLASIGLKVSGGVTYHGVAINVKPEISYFNKIVPCGLSSTSVTSFKEEGVKIDMNDLDTLLLKNFTQHVLYKQQ